MSVPDKAARISVRVYPNAAKNEVAGFADGVLRLKIAAPPMQGKANRELIDFLSQILGVSKSRLAIIRGHASRSKVIVVTDLSQDNALKRLLL